MRISDWSADVCSSDLRTMAISFTSIFLLMQQEVTHMMKQGRGCIINVSSMASLAAERQAPMAYCVAKAALNHMTSFAASDYARYGIRVNAILPGTTSTPMLHKIGRAHV